MSKVKNTNYSVKDLEEVLDSSQKLVIVHKGQEGTDQDGIPVDAFDVYAISTEYEQEHLQYLTKLVAFVFDYDLNDQEQILINGMNYDKAHSLKGTIAEALTGDYKAMEYQSI